MSNEPRVPGADQPRDADAAEPIEHAEPTEHADVNQPDASEPDPAVARLRAADPAASVAGPDLTALRAAVDARISDPTGSADPTGPTDEPAQVRARRWASWPARAAAVAAVALVVGGGGGYAIGASGGDDTPSALPAITLQGSGGAGDSAGGPAVAMDTSAMGGAEQAAADRAASTSLPYRSGRTVFTASGLSTEAGSAQAYALDARAAYSADAAAAAAAALGVSGEPRDTGWGWTVGPDDGTAPTVTLGKDGVVNLGFWDPTKDPWSCVAVAREAEETERQEGDADAPTSDGGASDGAGADGEEPAADSSAASSDVSVLPAPEECQERDLGPAPTGDAAVAVLRDVMAALGVDVGAYEFVVEEWGDATYSYVTGHHVVDGRRTGLQWNASLTGAGVQSLNGFTAPVVPLGEYAVVSPAEAVERLSDPRFSTGWGGPVAWLEGRDPYAPMAAEPGVDEAPDLPETPAAGARVPWAVDEVTIVEARLGVAHHADVDGASLLVPTYELIGDDGAIWTVIAVADEHLDLEG